MTPNYMATWTRSRKTWLLSIRQQQRQAISSTNWMWKASWRTYRRVMRPLLSRKGLVTIGEIRLTCFEHIVTAHAHKRLFWSFLSNIWPRRSLRRPRLPLRQMPYTEWCLWGVSYDFVLVRRMNMNLFNHNNNSADDYVQLNSCGCWIVRLAKPAIKTIQ